jgi:general secretion pathway protein K
MLLKNFHEIFGLKIISNNRGIALLVTLTITTVLIAASLEMNRRTRSTVYSAAATRDRITLLQMASAGVHAAKAILVKDKIETESDSIQEDWADPDKVHRVLQDFLFDDGTIKLTIKDELGKIQVNSLVEFPEARNFKTAQNLMWDRFLWGLIAQNESLEGTDPAAIINSIKDWLDAGDDDAITGFSGAESDYYLDLDPPYNSSNGPFSHLSELALVRGITPELFRGTAETPGISEYVTVYGRTATGESSFTYTGKININTADLPVLAGMLPPEEEGLAQAIFEYRQETSDDVYIHDLKKPEWYKNVPGLSDITIDPDLIRTTSDVFRIESAATLNNITLTVTAVLKRERDGKTGKWDCKALHWRAE